jgi:hypothetical protein
VVRVVLSATVEPWEGFVVAGLSFEQRLAVGFGIAVLAGLAVIGVLVVLFPV